MQKDIFFFPISTDEDLSFVLEFSGLDLTGRDFQILIKDRASGTTRATLTNGDGITVASATVLEVAYAKAGMSAWPTGEFTADVVDITDGANGRIMAVRFLRDMPGRLVGGVKDRKAFVTWVDNTALVTATGAIGPAGPVGPQGEQGIQGDPGADGADGTNGTDGADGANGDNGWSPEMAVASDGARRVLQVVDWVGGTGSKPATGDYVGAAGLTPTIGDAIDIRGPAGIATIPDGDKGDITTADSGDTWTIDNNAVVTAKIADAAVTNTKLANVATATFKGRTTAGTGAPEDLTATQATALLNAVVGDSGSGGTKGLVPAPASGDTAAKKYLSASGGWSSPLASGSIIQTVASSYTSYFSVTNSQQIPADNTIPQQTEGAEVTTVSITPTATTSKLRITASIPCDAPAAASAVISIFRDSTSNAIGAGIVYGQSEIITTLFASVEVTAGSTSATTFKMRVGPGSTPTVYFNGGSSGALFGGVLGARLIVEEIKA